MSVYLKKTFGNRPTYIIPLNTRLGDKGIFIDATDALENAKQRDHELGYRYEKGPNFGHEVMKAIEYGDYVIQYATVDNYYKFSTRRYSVFLSGAETPSET